MHANYKFINVNMQKQTKRKSSQVEAKQNKNKSSQVKAKQK